MQYLHNHTKTSHLKGMQMRDVPDIFPQPPSAATHSSTRWPWPIQHYCLICMLKAGLSICIYCVQVCESWERFSRKMECEINIFTARLVLLLHYVFVANWYVCLWCLGICRSIRFHSKWPVGFIIITHFNEVASNRTTRSLRAMLRWESAKTATRWFNGEWPEYQTGFTNSIILLAGLSSIISAMLREIHSTACTPVRPTYSGNAGWFIYRERNPWLPWLLPMIAREITPLRTLCCGYTKLLHRSNSRHRTENIQHHGRQIDP